MSTRPLRGPQPTVMPLIMAASAALAVLGLAAVAILPARPPSPALAQLNVMHDTMVANRSRVDHPVHLSQRDSPSIEAEADGILEGRRVESWVYRLGREAFSVHRVQMDSLVPSSASHLPLGARRVAFFELDDLEVLAWAPTQGEWLVVLGSGRLATQLRLAQWVDEHPPPIQGLQ